MAGVVKKKKGWDLELPAPLINEANKEALEASGECQRTFMRSGLVCISLV